MHAETPQPRRSPVEAKERHTHTCMRSIAVVTVQARISSGMLSKFQYIWHPVVGTFNVCLLISLPFRSWGSCITPSFEMATVQRGVQEEWSSVTRRCPSLQAPLRALSEIGLEDTALRSFAPRPTCVGAASSC
jgi:hypothetical protein